jgi:hypothetical protein
MWRPDTFWAATPHEFWTAIEGWERMRPPPEVL